MEALVTVLTGQLSCNNPVIAKRRPGYVSASNSCQWHVE